MADKINVRTLMSWITVSEDKSEVTLTLPGAICNLPNDIVINMDASFRPVSQRDTETAVWFWQNIASGLDADAKTYLRVRWVRATQFTVSYKAPVAMGKKQDSVWITKATTLAEVFAGLNRRARLIYSPIGTTVTVPASTTATV